MKNENVTTLQQINTITPLQILHDAIQKGADVETIKQLMELKREWETNESRKAYISARSDFSGESVEIIKKSKGHNSKYAKLGDELAIVTPLLSKHGLSHNWETSQPDNLITVTCRLTHVLGYSESTSLTYEHENSGSKNGIQAIGSTVSYLKRYTFECICGLASIDDDDDGNQSGKQRGYTEGLAEGLAYGMAIYKHKAVIEMVKDSLDDDNLEAAAEYLYSLTPQELSTINRAPTKGGIFTIEEKAKMDINKSEAWRAARKIGFEINKDVYRGA